MPERRVRHALITYEVNGRLEMAFRGEKVTVSADEAERYDALGATVPVSEDLPRAGTLATLPESPSDEELVGWVLAASEIEVKAVLGTRPELGPRIEGAYQHVVDARKNQDQVLGGAVKSAQSSPAVQAMRDALGNSAMLDPEVTVSSSPHPVGSSPVPAPSEGGDTPVLPGEAASDGPAVTITDPNESTTGGPNTTAEVEEQLARQDVAAATPTRTEAVLHVGDDEAGSDEAQRVIYGSVEDVRDFVADHPEQAEQVLAAEKANRALTGKEPRAGVVKAVETAVEHTK